MYHKESSLVQVTHTHTLSLSLSHTHTHTHTLSLSLTHTHTHTHTLSLSLSLTHTHTHTHTRTVLFSALQYVRGWSSSIVCQSRRLCSRHTHNEKGGELSYSWPSLNRTLLVSWVSGVCMCVCVCVCVYTRTCACTLCTCSTFTVQRVHIYKLSK